MMNDALINLPSADTPADVDAKLAKKADKVIGGTAGDLVELTGTGNIKDSNKTLNYDPDLDELITTTD